MYSECVKAVNDLLTHDDKKLIIALCGVSGSGKSTLAKHLCKSLNIDAHYMSLDVYREKIGGGKYPTKETYASVNKLAVVDYNKDLMSSSSRLLILDNTHLNFHPNCEALVQKAKNDNYHILFVTPPASLHSLFINKSTHGVDISTFLNMLYTYPGFSFSAFLNQIIQPKDVGYAVQPLKSSAFSKIGGMFANNGDALFYIVDGYLGYIDTYMVEAVLRAGVLMKKLDLGKYFLQKNSLVHMTIAQGKKDKLYTLLKKLIANESNIPQTEYTGIHHITKSKNTVWFVPVSEKSQLQWKNYILASEPDKSLSFNDNGLHVTLGYKYSDIHNEKKSMDNPSIPFTENDKVQKYVEPEFKGVLNELDNTAKNIQLTDMFKETLFANHASKDEMQLSMPASVMDNLSYFAGHSNVIFKWRTVPLKPHIWLLRVKVGTVNGSRSPDDEIYRSDVRLQETLPRGLYYIFELEESSATVNYIGIVYPTNKFFGDNDSGTDTELENQLVLEKIIKCASDVTYIETEKANGEMFTFTPIRQIDDHTFEVVLGSKNDKYLFTLDFNLMEKDWVEDIQTQIKSYPHACGVDLWKEMVRYFLLSSTAKTELKKLCEHLIMEKKTLCGEFESGQHPHIIPFPKDHQTVKIFAITSMLDDGTPKNIDVLAQMEELQLIRNYGLCTVNHKIVDIHSVSEYRKNVWAREGSEGVVLVVVAQKTKLVKLKTIWYVFYRGFRERTRRYLSNIMKNAAKKTVSIIKRESFMKNLKDVIQSKLSIFKEICPRKLSAEWSIKADAYITRVIDYDTEYGREALLKKLDVDFPSFY